MHIEGYATENGDRDALLVHNGQIASPDAVVLGEFRVLAGMTRQ